MLGARGKPHSRRNLRRVGLLLGGITAAAVALYSRRGMFIHHVAAEPAAQAGSAPPAQEASTGDYAARVVAYIHGSQAITRQDLGEYLIARYGAEKLPLSLNKRLVDQMCRQRGVFITAAEIDAAFAEDLKGLAIDQNAFIKNVLARYKKNLHEWKEDVLRPRLQMTRLIQDRLTVSDDDLRKAYESVYGEMVDCRIIVWPLDQERQAKDEFGKLRDSEPAFAEKAKKQADSAPASAGGRIRPIARYAMDETIEREAFNLRPGQVSTLIRTPQGIVLLRCDRRIPADTTVNLLAVKDKLTSEIKERKLQREMAVTFQGWREQARPQPLLQKSDRPAPGPVPPPTQVVAYLYGNQPVTREEPGEFLIARYGADKVEFLVNRRIIDHECQARGINVSDEEVERALQDDLKMLQCDLKRFEKELLGQWGKNLFEWREDVIRPRLLMNRLCQGRVKCTEEDIKKGFEAYHGERLECRIILWPPDQAKFALAEYAKIRDSEAEFDRKARMQPSPTLAAQGGRIPVFGRHVLGDENLEREAFKLQPGEVSALIGTPQGQVVIRCDKRIPPDTSVKLEQVRDKLAREALEKKVQAEMMVVFKELRDKAAPKLMLRPTAQVEDLTAQAKQLLSQDVPVGGLPKK